MRRAALSPILAPILAGALVAACVPGDRLEPGEERPLEEVEVGDVLDSEIDLSEDRKGPRVEEGVSGLLPSDFPADLPLFTPSSLIDFETGGPGRFILLMTPRPVAEVRSAQLALLREAGWSVEQAGGAWRLRRGGLQATLEIERAAGATEIRIAY